MAVHAFFGNCNSRNSRYYLDPTVQNGECVTVKPGDPEKEKAYKEKTKKFKRTGLGRFSSKIGTQNKLSEHLRKYSQL